MRIGVLVVGVILLILGAVLLFVPVLPMQSQTVTPHSPDIFNITTAFSPTGQEQLSITWTSSTSVEFLVVTCSGINLSGSNLSNSCRGLSVIGFENGTSGSFNFATKLGSTVFAGIIASGSGSATVNVSGSSPILATVLLGIGVLLAIVGVALKKKGKGAPAPTAAAPQTAAADPSPSADS